MLVLSRRVGERLIVNNNVAIEVLGIQGKRIRLGITAPAGVSILREELWLNNQAANQMVELELDLPVSTALVPQ